VEIRSESEMMINFFFTAEVALSEVIREGPDALAKRVREMLEVELKPLLGLSRKAEKP